MSVDLSSLTGVLGQLTSAIPTSNDIANQVITGAAASVVLAGLKSQTGQDAIDPLHLFHANGSSTVIGKSITASAFASLDAATKAQVLAAGYVISG